MNLTREDLNRMWNEWRQNTLDEDVIHTTYSREEAQKQFDALLAAERTFIDREVQARAMRWAADRGCTLGSANRVYVLADRIENGEVEVPK